MQRQIRANYDNEGIFIYQAYNPEIAAEALSLGTFGKKFKRDRMTWIKPSFGWMLYRSGYASKSGQERILKIKLTHSGFQEILSQVVLTKFEPKTYPSKLDWQIALKNSLVRCQWDGDRDRRLHRCENRAIQLGIRGRIVISYVNDWIIGIEDVTPLAHAIKTAVENNHQELPPVPEETIYPVSSQIQAILGMNSHRITHTSQSN
ncbi:MAG: DUF4291 domain-containing protein [Oscillatoria sp. PMC 1051.18]|nr:DUF4291 domain-containing protein [Oscillatoria sp. PMC 1050.18]MEC5033246.1 DUF4291 domain-containing protein [Oscillatoria sp. PMC 1051.18]